MENKPEKGDKEMEIPKYCEPKIQNIVSTVNLSCILDLKQIAWKGRNTEYLPNRFAAVIMRLLEPKTTALVFGSGRMVVTGAKSREDSTLASRKYARIIEKIGFPVKFKDFKIQNIVASCDLKFAIHLEKLEQSHKKCVQYEPEVFPGLVYKMADPKIVFLIFVSGKIVITGAKDEAFIREGFREIYKIVYACRKIKPEENKPSQ